MKSTDEILEKIIREEKRRLVSEETLAYFQDNEEYVQSLLTKIESMKLNMCDRLEEVSSKAYSVVSENEGKVRSTRSMPAYVLYDHCEHSIEIEELFCLAIETIITPQGWSFKVYAREYFNSPVEENNKRATAWYEAQPGPRTFPYKAKTSEVADHLKRLIESALTDPFPLPE